MRIRGLANCALPICRMLCATSLSREKWRGYIRVWPVEEMTFFQNAVFRDRRGFGRNFRDTGFWKRRRHAWS